MFCPCSWAIVPSLVISLRAPPGEVQNQSQERTIGVGVHSKGPGVLPEVSKYYILLALPDHEVYDNERLKDYLALSQLQASRCSAWRPMTYCPSLLS